MGVHIEVQNQEETMQIKSRELQMENTEKLNNILPVVENISDVNLVKIETDTSEIKNMVSQNLDEQIDLNDISDAIERINKNISGMKGQITKLSKKVDETLKSFEKGD